MKALYIIPIFFISLLQAQNWAPVNLNDIYNFKASLSAAPHSIWVDSVNLEGSDSVFYLNRLVKRCDTCLNLQNSGSCRYILVDQPQFYQRIIRKKANGIYIFENPDTMELHPFSGVGSSWVYSRRLNITAWIGSLDTISVLGVRDSAKFISLSTGDLLVLTKNHGFVSFFDHSRQKDFSLVGIERGRTLGEQVPQTLDFYDFEIGDEFQYLTTQCSPFGSPQFPFGSCTYSLIKKRITGKNLGGDSVQYSQISFTRTYTRGIPIAQIPDISDTPDHGGQRQSTYAISPKTGFDPEGYHGQIIECRDYGGGLVTAGLFEEYSFLPDPKLLTKGYGIGFFTIQGDTSGICDSNYYGEEVLATFELPDIRKYYQLGVGLAYFSAEHLDNWYESKLLGYVKNGDTTGLVFSDQDYATSNDELESAMSVKIFPNPSDGKYYLAFESASRAALQLKVYDITGALVHRDRHFPDGREIEIDLGGHPPGMYLMQLEQDGRYHSQRIMLR